MPASYHKPREPSASHSIFKQKPLRSSPLCHSANSSTGAMSCRLSSYFPQSYACQQDTLIPRGHPETRLELAISDSRRPSKNGTYTDISTGLTRTGSMAPRTRTLRLRTGTELMGCHSLLGFPFPGSPGPTSSRTQTRAYCRDVSALQMCLS